MSALHWPGHFVLLVHGRGASLLPRALAAGSGPLDAAADELRVVAEPDPLDGDAPIL